MALYLTNPLHCDINPGTTEGAKLYNLAIKAPEEKLCIAQKNARAIQAAFEEDANNVGWGTLSGTVKLDGVNHGPTRNIITHTCELTLKMVQKHARTTFGTLDPWGNDLPATFLVRTIDPATHAAQHPVFYRH